MPGGFVYDLWNGKEVVGQYNATFPLAGDYIIVQETSAFKQFYSQKPKVIRVPLVFLVKQDDGVEIVFRKVLDVRRKSKRQIDILRGIK
jgi:hypothetical protein